MAKNKETEAIIEKIYDYSLEEIMETGFGRYSKEIIQERALPDVRDGLKPVQRRILYAMYLSGFTHNKPYRKSAKAVGDIMGNFHPHGDSSIYDALIRLSQPWKMRETLIDIHGNNGSIDGDGAAAMRYTEARLSKFAEVMLEGIKKNTVEMTWNFDDTEKEPTVLPAYFPNLLVNGSTGISAGYATNIPPHNLGEVIDATIKRIESPNCTLEDIMSIMPGPDFPTAGVIEGRDGLVEAYKTGKGKVILKAKTEIVEKGNKKQIIIHSIPYDVIKEQLVKKIIDIKIDKKIEGINDVIDESSHEHMARIVIDLKSGANAELVLNYLLKNTDLQINYNFNMVAIVNRRPKLVGILEILDAFIAHQKEVITRRTAFDLEVAKKNYHILEGLLKAISILDEVIALIRSSKNKTDAKENLVKEFAFTMEQAEAIVTLQLYRLTNTDIVALQEEMAKLQKDMYIWGEILNNENALKHVMKQELKTIKKEYDDPRRTEIKDEVTEIKIDLKSMIPLENVVVIITNEGYIKRVSMKSFQSNSEEPPMKPGDYIKNMFDVSTRDHIVIFTNLGNYLFVPVYKIPDSKWKELGKHINNLITLSPNESVIAAFIYHEKKELVMASLNGMVKRIKMSDLFVTRTSKAMIAMKLKEQDEVIGVVEAYKNVMLVSRNGYYVLFNKLEVPLVGVRGSGVKGINLKDDALVALNSYMDADYITLFTNQKTAKRIKINDIYETGRAKRGLALLKKVKSTNYEVLKCLVIHAKEEISYITDDGIINIRMAEIPIMDTSSTGSVITKKDIIDVIPKISLESLQEPVIIEEEKIEAPTESQISFDLDEFKL